MTERGARGLAWGLFAGIMTLVAAGVAFVALDTTPPADAWGGHGLLPGLAFVIPFTLFPVVGLWIVLRRPSNSIGWLMLGIGVAFGLSVASEYGGLAVENGWPWGVETIALATMLWVPMVGLAGTFLLLLFPDGHLPSPRWRWFAWATGTLLALVTTGGTFAPGSLAEDGYPQVQNPFGLEALDGVLAVLQAGIAAIPIAIVGSAVSLAIRYRRSGAIQRAQIKWPAAAAVTVAIVFGCTMVANAALADSSLLPLIQNVALLSFGLIPASVGVAVLRHQLYEIDVVLRKAVVVAAMTAVFTAVYVAIVGGIGAVVGSTSTPALSFAAAAVVAVIFQPALSRARRLADRAVYGRRATPYEVLAEFSERVADTFADDDVLPRMARVVGEAVGARRADVWLRVDDRMRVAASWPEGTDAPPATRADRDGLGSLPGADAAFAVEHRGEFLGALTVAMPASDPMDEAKSKLVSDLAAQAGLVLRNVRLTEDLRARLEDLRAAQKRLVTAQDEERRRLERNIHDGAQQQLVALSVKLRLARGLVAKDPPIAEAMLDNLQAETQSALEDLRDLARGIYPPLLADKGLGAALEAQARRSLVPVTVEVDGLGRYPQEIEAAVYFSCLEALQNVAKYAEARSARVTLAHVNGELRFEITDDGRGFDTTATGYGTGLQGIADRLAALEGNVVVRSIQSGGTTVSGSIAIADGRLSDRATAVDPPVLARELAEGP